MAKKKRVYRKKKRLHKKPLSLAKRARWTLERDGITQSGLTKWQTCPEQFALSYIEGLEHVKIKEALEFGSLFHCCLEHRGELEPLDAMDKYRRHAAKTHDADYMARLDFLMYQVDAIFPAYEAQYPLTKEAKILDTEKSFSIPVSVLGTDFHVRGKRDAEISAGRGGRALKEVKTKSTIDKDKIRHLLRSDLQTLMYLWSMKKEYGKCPAYLLYDVIKRPTLKVTQKETLPQHFERVRQHAFDRPDMYFFRWKVDPVTDNDIDQFEQLILMPLLRHFVSWWQQVRRNPFDRFQSPLHHLNLHALSDPYKVSDFYDYLILQKPENYQLKSSAHPELSV